MPDHLTAPVQGKESPSPTIERPTSNPTPGLAWQFAGGEFSEIEDRLPPCADDEDLNGLFAELGFSDTHFLDVAVGYSVSESIAFGVPASANEDSESVSINVAKRETPTTRRWPWFLAYCDLEGVGIAVCAATHFDFFLLLQEVVKQSRKPRRGGSRR